MNTFNNLNSYFTVWNFKLVAQPSRLRKTENCYGRSFMVNVKIACHCARSKATKQSMYKVAPLSLTMTLVCQIVI